MKTTLLVVGKTTDAHIVSLIAEYEKRLTRFAQFDIEVIPELRAAKALSQAEQKEREGVQILARLTPSDRVVLLDEVGRELKSTEFAEFLSSRMNMGLRRLVFVVGGPYGFSPAVYARADERLSLSRMTFSHQMVRLFFVEQLYRAHTILGGLPYHHE